MSKNSFGAKRVLEVSGKNYEIFDITGLEGSASLPFSLKILLENLLRTEDGANITAAQIKALANWNPDSQPDTEIQFTPARVIMQDFTGVPCVVDLATMREAIAELGGNPTRVNPLAPAELVIDHSVIADKFGTSTSFEENVDIEYQRNTERYRFLRWGQTAFDGATRNWNSSPGKYRIFSSSDYDKRSVWNAPRLSRHGCWNGLSHNHGQWPWRSWLGRWWN
ncbi:MAG: hypothetical protein RLZZ35_412 [Actinomycetota bacterium]